MTSFYTLLYLAYMSKSAVLLLVFFIASILIVAPVIKPELAQGSVLIVNQSSSQQVASVELLAKNYPRLRSLSTSKGQKTKVVETLITAYSSSPDETDSTPFITASGSYVRNGVVAANFLPFGTQIRIPEIFGDQIFTVEDRLHKMYNDRIDVWFPSKGEALKFGFKITKIEIL